MDREGGSNGGGSPSSSYYAVLGIHKEASFSDVRSAYRKLAMKWHPDRFATNPAVAGEAKRRFQQIQEAYSVLSDETKRSMYDAGLYDPLEEEDEDFYGFMQEMLSMMNNVKDEGESFEDLQRMFVDMVDGGGGGGGGGDVMGFNFNFNFNADRTDSKMPRVGGSNRSGTRIRSVALLKNKMRIRLRDSLKTAEGDWYEDEDRCRFMTSCFGHFLTMHREMKFSSGIIHQLLLRELHHNDPTDEMQFMLGNQSVRFSKVEFYLIIGLRFGVVPDTTKYAAMENGLYERYFPGADDVSLEEIMGVVTGAEFGKAYDAVKLCLLYMLNWILIGVDKRFKIRVWQFRLVEDLDAFDAFQWGAHVYKHFIYSFKHALDGRQDWFERRQQEKGADVHRVETYNIYGLSHALLMFTRKELVPTSAERQAPYYAWLDEGGSLYEKMTWMICRFRSLIRLP
ncbi:hypothetical protein Ddye_026335 [Dipteronia dyeriana]|uniref:J domain-containing protein n=1 Tax=Dipteronia dyeriana TaxID=168575 RepID=A0AAD9TM13_9ROSI|nr:hypothetical protein Ddye_026335 [Dipteronia dyeriana]